MKSLRNVVACCLVLSFVGLAFAEKKKDDSKATNKDKLVGVWEITKGEGAPPGATVEFTKDGKMILNFKVEEKAVKIDGTYSLDGDSIKTNMKIQDKEIKETAKIKKLTDKELVIEDEKGKTEEFKKKK